MKKVWKKATLWLFSVALMAALTGCGVSESKMMSDAAVETATQETWDEAIYTEEVVADNAVAETEEYDTVATEEAGTGTSEELDNTVASNRKLIRRVNMNVETQSFTEMTQYIENKVSELGGYMEQSDIYGGSYEYEGRRRNADYTARVPVDKLDELVGAVAKQGNVTNKSESATDVTLTYVDTKSRKEASEVEYERLMELLEKAEDIDTIVALESRLTTVRYEIQSLESQLRTYDNLVDFATVEISVSEVVIYTPTEPEKKTDIQRMAEGFVNSTENIFYDIKELAIEFVIVLPYLIVWAVIIGIVILAIRKIRKRRRIKKEKKNAERNENGVCDSDRKTERREVNTDESADRSENSDNLK